MGRIGSMYHLTGEQGGVGCAADGGDSEPTPMPADPSDQPGRGAVHGTGGQRVPPNRGAIGGGMCDSLGRQQAHTHADRCRRPDQQGRPPRSPRPTPCHPAGCAQS